MEQKPVRRKLRLYKIILWSVFIISLALCLIIGTKSQQISRTHIQAMAAEQLGKDIDELTKSDYLSIKELNLSNQPISDIRFLKKFPNLQKLNIGDIPQRVYDLPSWKSFLAKWGIGDTSNRKTISLKPLKKMTNLQTLELNNANVKSFKPLSNLISLKELNLSNTGITDLEPLKYLINLQHLKLFNTEISDLEPLKDMVNLKELDLRYTQVNDLEHLKELTNLEELYLARIQVTDLESIRRLTNLRALQLTGTQVSDLEPLYGLTNLQRLIIRNCINITFEEVEELEKALPELRIY